jgi:hypothetical protein
MVTGVLTATGVVVIWNAGEVMAEAATVTDEGTAATAGLLLVSVTTADAGGATDSSVTLLDPADVTPPVTADGDRFTAATPSGVTVMVAVTLTAR